MICFSSSCPLLSVQQAALHLLLLFDLCFLCSQTIATWYMLAWYPWRVWASRRGGPRACFLSLASWPPWIKVYFLLTIQRLLFAHSHGSKRLGLSCCQYPSAAITNHPQTSSTRSTTDSADTASTRKFDAFSVSVTFYFGLVTFYFGLVTFYFGLVTFFFRIYNSSFQLL